jgi:hypothetical protein
LSLNWARGDITLFPPCNDQAAVMGNPGLIQRWQEIAALLPQAGADGEQAAEPIAPWRHWSTWLIVS